MDEGTQLKHRTEDRIVTILGRAEIGDKEVGYWVQESEAKWVLLDKWVEFWRIAG